MWMTTKLLQSHLREVDAAMSDGREERDEQEWRRREDEHRDREDRLERYPQDERKPERKES